MILLSYHMAAVMWWKALSHLVVRIHDAVQTMQLMSHGRIDYVVALFDGRLRQSWVFPWRVVLDMEQTKACRSEREPEIIAPKLVPPETRTSSEDESSNSEDRK